MLDVTSGTLETSKTIRLEGVMEQSVRLMPDPIWLTLSKVVWFVEITRDWANANNNADLGN
jgi:hypothetical protein